MLTQSQYEANEALRLQAELTQISKAPLSDRQAARKEWLDALVNDSDLIRERISWLFEGCYGKGAYDAAWKIAESSERNNKTAQIGQLIAAMEWRCPPDFARKAWVSLTPERQRLVNVVIQSAINRAVKERGV